LRIGAACKTGETGEIWVKSPYLFEGYETGSSALTRWQDGFVSIGEMGKLDAAGYLYLQGRRSRMVTVADQNVFPEAIEAVLMAQSEIEAAAVITPTDPLRGHIIVAVVVGKANAADLRKLCRAELGEAAVPRKIWNMSSMPMLPAGKPDLQYLETLWEESKE
jgi:long-chain acyl-CoA synthetase